MNVLQQNCYLKLVRTILRKKIVNILVRKRRQQTMTLRWRHQ